ncbi:MAG: SDR family oxidoreductase [Phycisphaerales bacterium]|jgi:NAD(P)-dependent dehydrogenase (short-subunit alcohol dehydrogenase family)
MSSTTPVSIVTGAGSGIGAACARLLAARGHAVVLVGRGFERLEAVRASMDEPTRHLSMAADVADSGLAHDVVDRTLEAYGRIDALVLNAGVAPKAPIDQTTEEVLEQAFFVNAFGPAFMVTRAWPAFKRQRSGRVVFVSTLGTIDPFPGFFAYAASKSAVDSFARSIRAEGKAIGVKAFAVNPGCVETEILRRNFPEKVIPRERALPPEAVAEVIVACACGERDAENGNAIVVPSP